MKTYMNMLTRLLFIAVLSCSVTPVQASGFWSGPTDPNQVSSSDTKTGNIFSWILSIFSGAPKSDTEKLIDRLNAKINSNNAAIAQLKTHEIAEINELRTQNNYINTKIIPNIKELEIYSDELKNNISTNIKKFEEINKKSGSLTNLEKLNLESISSTLEIQEEMIKDSQDFFKEIHDKALIADHQKLVDAYSGKKQLGEELVKGMDARINRTLTLPHSETVITLKAGQNLDAIKNVIRSEVKRLEELKINGELIAHSEKSQEIDCLKQLLADEKTLGEYIKNNADSLNKTTPNKTFADLIDASGKNFKKCINDKDSSNKSLKDIFEKYQSKNIVTNPDTIQKFKNTFDPQVSVTLPNTNISIESGKYIDNIQSNIDYLNRLEKIYPNKENIEINKCLKELKKDTTIFDNFLKDNNGQITQQSQQNAFIETSHNPSKNFEKCLNDAFRKGHDTPMTLEDLYKKHSIIQTDIMENRATLQAIKNTFDPKVTLTLPHTNVSIESGKYIDNIQLKMNQLQRLTPTDSTIKEINCLSELKKNTELFDGFMKDNNAQLHVITQQTSLDPSDNQFTTSFLNKVKKPGEMFNTCMNTQLHEGKTVELRFSEKSAFMDNANIMEDPKTIAAFEQKLNPGFWEKFSTEYGNLKTTLEVFYKEKPEYVGVPIAVVMIAFTYWLLGKTGLNSTKKLTLSALIGTISGLGATEKATGNMSSVWEKIPSLAEMQKMISESGIAKSLSDVTEWTRAHPYNVGTSILAGGLLAGFTSWALNKTSIVHGKINAALSVVAGCIGTGLSSGLFQSLLNKTQQDGSGLGIMLRGLWDATRGITKVGCDTPEATAVLILIALSVYATSKFYNKNRPNNTGGNSPIIVVGSNVGNNNNN